jgi:hypothetical protein
VEAVSDTAADRYRIFEQAALDRLRAGDDATRPVSFLPLPVRLTAAFALAIAAACVAWAFLARVPIQVDGTAAIVPESPLKGLNAEVSGTLHYQVSGVGRSSLPADQQRDNALLSRYWLEDLSNLVGATSEVIALPRLKRLVDAALRPLSGVTLELPGAGERDFAYDKPGDRAQAGPVLHLPAGTILAAIDAPDAHLRLNSALLASLPTEQLQRDTAAAARRHALELGRMEALQAQQQQELRAELNDRLGLLSRFRSLARAGAITESSLLEESSRINGLRSQLRISQREALNTRIGSGEQADRSRQALNDSTQTRSQLEDELIAYLAATRLFVPETGAYLLAANFADGSRIQKGDRLVSYTTEPPALPRSVPVFLTGVSAQQVDEGMAVLLTPRGISRAQFGGITGVVSEVRRIPLSADALLGVVGSRSLAQLIQAKIPSAYMVRVSLERAEPAHCRQALSRRCYRWSSGRLPPHPVRLASLADVQITTAYQHPVEFVMPALRRALGLVVEPG